MTETKLDNLNLRLQKKTFKTHYMFRKENFDDKPLQLGKSSNLQILFNINRDYLHTCRIT